MAVGTTLTESLVLLHLLFKPNKCEGRSEPPVLQYKTNRTLWNLESCVESCGIFRTEVANLYFCFSPYDYIFTVNNSTAQNSKYKKYFGARSAARPSPYPSCCVLRVLWVVGQQRLTLDELGLGFHPEFSFYISVRLSSVHDSVICRINASTQMKIKERKHHLVPGTRTILRSTSKYVCIVSSLRAAPNTALFRRRPYPNHHPLLLNVGAYLIRSPYFSYLSPFCLRREHRERWWFSCKIHV